MARRWCNVEGNWEHAYRPGPDPRGRGLDVKVHAVAQGDRQRQLATNDRPGMFIEI